MSQAGFTPIQLYFSTTAAAVPVNTNLANGELAINITDEKLYFKNAAGTVKLLASNATSAPVLSFSAGTTGFTPSTATTGAVTLAGTLATTNGGTGLTSFTSGGVVYASSTSALATGSVLSFDGTKLSVGSGASTSAGLTSGYFGASGYGAIWSTSVTPSTTNFAFLTNGTSTGINGSSSVFIQANNTDILNINTLSVYTTSGIKVGIGLSNPASNLDIVVASGTASIKVGNGTVSGGSYLNLQGASGTKTWFVANNYNVAGALEFIQSTANGGSTPAGTSSMLLDTSGNLGLGVTPSAWGSSYRALQVGQASSLYNIGANTVVGNNAYNDGTNTRYITSSFASLYVQTSGAEHAWYTAPSGTAGNVISFTQAMTLNASGQLGIGTTSPNRQLELSTFIAGAPTGTGFVGGALRLSNLTEYESNYGTGGGNPDFLGSIEFYSGDGSTGTGVRTAIKTTVDAYYNENSLCFYTAPAATAGILERMRISPGGNVGIGINAPTQVLDVRASQGWITATSTTGTLSSLFKSSNTGGSSYFGRDNSTGGVLGSAAYATVVYGSGAYPMTFHTNDTERMRIYANGGLSFANTASPGPFNTVLGDRNNHFTGQRSNTVPGSTTSTMLTITFSINGAAIVRVVDCGTIVTSNYFTNVYEYFVTCFNGTVTATLKQSQLGSGAGSFITTSTGSYTFNVIQTTDGSLVAVHDTAVDVLVVSAGNGTHDTTTITMAANN